MTGGLDGPADRARLVLAMSHAGVSDRMSGPSGLACLSASSDRRQFTRHQIRRDHENRLRTLETFKSKAMGMAIAAGLFSGFLDGVIGYFIGHLH